MQRFYDNLHTIGGGGVRVKFNRIEMCYFYDLGRVLGDSYMVPYGC